MGSLIRHGLVIGSCVVAIVVASSGCTAKKATEYVSGISTQMQVPRDIKSIRLQISVGGAQQFCRGYKVYDGQANLPRSLGNFPNNTDSINGEPIRYEISGLDQDFDETAEFFSLCDAATVKQDNVRLLRSSTQPYIQDHILFLPMPLKFSCYDVDCSATPGTTCKGGQCVSETLSADDARKLPDFVEGMGDGNDGACFSVGLCMGAAVPAIPTNRDTCDFVLPESNDAPKLAPDQQDPFRPKCTTIADCNGGVTPANTANARQCGTTTPGQCDLLPAGSPPWTGLNVQVSYDGARTTEILDLDPVEGYTIPDPTKPQTFRLSPGLCNMWKNTNGNAHRITGVLASGTCGPKTSVQDICHADQLAIEGLQTDGTAQPVGACTVNQLTPTKAALMVIVDNTTGHAGFFQPDQITSFETPLNDPAFTSTQFGLMYAPNNTGDACNGNVNRPVALPLEPSSAGATDIPANLLKVVPFAGNPSFAAAMAASYKYLNANAGGYLRRGVLVVGNRQFNTDPCGTFGTPLQLATAALAQPNPINTYVLKVVSDPAADPATTTTEAADAQTLAGAGYTRNASDPLIYNPVPATAAEKKTAFQTVVNRLGTCAYDLDTSAGAFKPDTTSTLTYADPLTNKQQSIAYNAGCKSDNDSGNDGWGFDATGTHVFVCGKPCSDYQAITANASNFTLLYDQTALAVPLYATAATCTSLPKQ